MVWFQPSATVGRSRRQQRLALAVELLEDRTVLSVVTSPAIDEPEIHSFEQANSSDASEATAAVSHLEHADSANQSQTDGERASDVQPGEVQRTQRNTPTPTTSVPPDDQQEAAPSSRSTATVAADDGRQTTTSTTTPTTTSAPSDDQQEAAPSSISTTPVTSDDGQHPSTPTTTTSAPADDQQETAWSPPATTTVAADDGRQTAPPTTATSVPADDQQQAAPSSTSTTTVAADDGHPTTPPVVATAVPASSGDHLATANTTPVAQPSSTQAALTQPPTNTQSISSATVTPSQVQGAIVSPANTDGSSLAAPTSASTTTATPAAVNLPSNPLSDAATVRQSEGNAGKISAPVNALDSVTVEDHHRSKAAQVGANRQPENHARGIANELTPPGSLHVNDAPIGSEQSLPRADEPLPLTSVAPSAGVLQGEGLITEAAPFDLAVLSAGLTRFLDDLQAGANQVLHAPLESGWTPWIVAASLATAVMELGRQQLKGPAPALPLLGQGRSAKLRQSHRRG